VRVPAALCALSPGPDGWCAADILVENKRLTSVATAGSIALPDAQKIDAGGSVLLSGLVDCHTHVDKAHTAAFTTFPPGDLASAIKAATENKQSWTRENIQARVEFSLKSAYAYGVRAMRSHVDGSPASPAFAGEVMREARQRWQGRVDLQLSPLAGIGFFEDPEFCQDLFSMADQYGRLGAFLFDQPDLAERLHPLFERASASGWDLDFHVDEGLNPDLNGLEAVAQVALATKFKGTVLCGHCAALSVYPRDKRERVIGLALEAGLHFVALPSSNLYLQSRDADGAPVQRGMGPVARLAERGATVSLGADNVRDAFCAFGDFDPVAVLNLGAQVGHLHEPARDWAALVTCNPARSMGLDWDGEIAPGASADMVLFAARNSGEMNLRGNAERLVIRQGKFLDVAPPAFSELVP